MGVAIIALTILVRLALLPSTMKSLLAQKKLKDLQPEIEKIKKDHGHDQEKMAKATMELYQRHGVNPLSSCLPLLIQFPIFIALYQVFFRLAQSGQLNMLYPFISKPEVINTHFLWFDLAKPDHFYILPVLAGATLFWQSKMMTPGQKTEKKEQKTADFQTMLSKQMLYLFPLMTVFIALRLPSALALYWVITTLFGIIQQYLILRRDGEVKGLRGAKGTIVTIRKREDK
jgi:YidC/Oxa1 family membrane protein insertase